MSNVVKFDSVRSVAFGSITASYVALGTAFSHEMRILHFINNTNGDVMLSFDGVNDNIPVIANTFSLYDFTSDQDANEKLRIQSGSQIYIKYIGAPSTGTFYLAAVYGKGE